MSQAGSNADNPGTEKLEVQKQKAIDVLCQTARAVNTPSNLDQTLYAILEHISRVLPYRGAIVLLQEDEKHLRTATAAGFADADRVAPAAFTSRDAPALFQALRHGRTLITSQPQPPIEMGPFTLSRPIRTWAIAPLEADTVTLGLVILVSDEVGAFGEGDLSLIDAFADHMAMAVAKQRLVQETDQRLRELAFLNETGQAITSTLNLDRILQLLLEHVRDLLQIDAASIALRDEQTGELVFEAASGEGSAGVLGVRLEPGQGVAGWVAETGKPLVVHDAYKDARFFSDVDEQTGMTTQAIVCVPIVLKGQVVGVIEALNPGEVPFNAQAIELLDALASQAATAIHNARLFAQVRSAEARYEGLFEDSVSPIVITNLKGTILDVNRNACSILGQAKETLQGTNVTQFPSADGSLDFVAPLKQILAGQDAIFQTTVLSDGQRTTVEIKGKQITVKGTTLIQWIGRDISAEIELEQTREDMVRMIVHDLRNPLANIMNSLDVLDDVIAEKDDSVSHDELVNIARRSGQRLQQLISSILDISRLETGQAILETRPTDVGALIHEAVEFVHPQADIRDMELITDLETSLPRVKVDRDMIARVILNLLDNAIKFTQVGGTVRVTAQSKNSAIQVAVADNGPGIPSEQLTTIFEKFTRVRRKDSPKGTGLGLAFCHLAIEAHGGEIWAESRLGQGTTLKFTLPAHPPDEMSPEAN